MANATYTLISSQVLGSGAASVTFSSIPQTYKDLAVRISVRSDGTNGATNYFGLVINSDSSSLYSSTNLQGDGQNASSSRVGSTVYLSISNYTNTNDTANTFSSVEMYIPNYTSTANKPLFNFGVGETNNTYIQMQAVAGLYRNSIAISSLTFTVEYASNFVTGSSFYLYGI
jgi:hypothetical protein